MLVCSATRIETFRLYAARKDIKEAFFCSSCHIIVARCFEVLGATFNDNNMRT
jgi:uncharacterized membrane protein